MRGALLLSLAEAGVLDGGSRHALDVDSGWTRGQLAIKDGTQKVGLLRVAALIAYS